MSVEQISDVLTHVQRLGSVKVSGGGLGPRCEQLIWSINPKFNVNIKTTNSTKAFALTVNIVIFKAIISSFKKCT